MWFVPNQSTDVSNVSKENTTPLLYTDFEVKCMDYITMMQEAVDFMEAHLLEPISYQEVARHVYVSGYHFHRTFSMLTGLTVNEYIRNRRLSMAGQDIAGSDEKVISLALKYGYESPESFTRAFTRFHGISPSVARKSGLPLKLYNRLILKLIMEGGMIMQYRIVEREPFKLIAKTKQFPNAIIADDFNTDIADYWRQCSAEGIFDVLSQRAEIKDLYGVCEHLSQDSDNFSYGIGMIYNQGVIPEGYNLWEVRPTLWAVFPCIGDSGACIGETWQKIFKEFLPTSGYEMLDQVDFELYPAISDRDVFCEIWIPIAKK